MNSDFQKKYSKYYNLFYSNKDYEKEAIYLRELINNYKPNSKKLLELGCGTGKHAAYLAKHYSITAIDRSSDMIDVAINLNKDNNIKFVVSSIQGYNSNKKFDCAYSLFHVINYHNTNDDLNNFFKVASNHLVEDGLLIFDFWYGSAVLTDPPQNKLKSIETDNENINRITTAELNENKNQVEVIFDFLVKNKNTKQCLEFSEKHIMRYLFLPEIEYYAKMNNMKVYKYLTWLDLEKEPSKETWYALAIVKKLK